MKKEYHLTITRKDRIYLTVFVVFLLGWELIKPVIILIGHDDGVKTLAVVETPAIHPFEVNDRSSGSKLPDEPTLTEKEEEIEGIPLVPVIPIQILTASPGELMAIGFNKKAAFNVEKYLRAGGPIRNEKELLKIYGMDSAQLQRVLPYIRFPESVRKENPDSTERFRTFKNGPLLDLNTATAEALEKLPGIGTKLADRLIKFREALGGYASLDQLTECYGLPTETLIKIKPLLTLQEPVKTIDINHLDPAAFSHPYLDKRLLRTIHAYIQNHGLIEDASELHKIFPPDTTWVKRILPYLRYN